MTHARVAAPSQPVLVLIHGLFSSPQEFALVTRVLRDRQVVFDALEVPGYTQGRGRQRLSWTFWLAAAGRALDARYPAGTPIVLGGLCVGGAIAAALAALPRVQQVAGVALLAPTFAFDGWAIRRRAWCRRLAYALHVDRWLSIRESEPYGIRNPKMRRWVKEQLAAQGSSAVGPGRLSLRAIRESERLYGFVRRAVPSLRMPILVVHARDDELATVTSVERVLATAEATVRLEVVEHSYHMITLDNDRQRVAHALADFVGAPAIVRPPSASGAPRVGRRVDPTSMEHP